MGRVAFIDGLCRAPEAAQVSVYDRGFLYGDSVFETIRTYGGELYALEEHMQRLKNSAAQVGIELPVGLEQLCDETREAVAEAGNDESYARIMLTRGVGPVGLDVALAERPLRVILVEPLTLPPFEQYQNGIAAMCVQTVRASDAAHSAKLGNYLASALALRDARASGALEALVVSPAGFVVEGTTSNLFAVQDGVVITPPIGRGVLDGITRRRVIELVHEAGYKLEYRCYRPTEIASVDELFLTSSIREIMPIVRVDQAAIGNGKPGEVTQALHRAFRGRMGLGARLPFESE